MSDPDGNKGLKRKEIKDCKVGVIREGNVCEDNV